jgi:hypothetical protein
MSKNLLPQGAGAAYKKPAFPPKSSNTKRCPMRSRSAIMSAKNRLLEWLVAVAVVLSATVVAAG